MQTLKRICLPVLLLTLPAVAAADISGYFGIGVGGARVERDDIDLSFDEYSEGLLGARPPYNTGTLRELRARVQDPEGTDFSFKVFGGARFGRYIGVEAGYLNLGEAEDATPLVIPAVIAVPPAPPAPDPRTILRPQQDRQIDVETSIDGWQLALVGFLPLTDSIEVFAKVGAYHWDRKTRVIDRIGSLAGANQPGIPEILLSDVDTQVFLGRSIEGEAEPDGETFTRLEASDDGTDLTAGAGLNIKASERVTLRAELEWLDIDGTSLTWTGNVSLVFGF